MATTSSSAPSTASALPFPTVSLPLTAIKDPLESDVLCGRGGAAQRHAGNQHYRSLVSTNKPYYTTCPKPEKLKISRSIVATIREANGRFLERAVDGLYYDIGDKKAVEKTSQALREGQPKMRKKIQALKEGKRQSLDSLASSTTGSGSHGVAQGQQFVSSIHSSPEDFDVQHNMGGIVDPNLEAAAAGFRSPLLDGQQQQQQAAAYGQAQQYGSDPSALAANALAQAQAAQGGQHQQPPLYEPSVERTASGTPYVHIGAPQSSHQDTMEISEKSFRNLQAEAAAGVVYGRQGGQGGNQVSNNIEQQIHAQQAQMQMYQRQLDQRQRELHAQQREMHMQQQQQQMHGLASPSNGQTNQANQHPGAVGSGQGEFADISPIGHYDRDGTERSRNVTPGDGGDNDRRSFLEGFRPPSFVTRSLAEEIQHQQEELQKLLQQQQAQMQQHGQQQQYQPEQQQSQSTVSNISLMSTFSAIGDSGMSLGMLVSGREVAPIPGGSPSDAAGSGGGGPAATTSPQALAAAARAQGPQASAIEPLVAASSAAVPPATHPNPEAGPVSIWDASESNRDLATLVAGNTSIPQEKVMDYMADIKAEATPNVKSGPRRLRRNSSVASRRQIFASMKRDKRPSTVEASPAIAAESGGTMSSVSSDTIGSKQASSASKASAAGSGDVGSDVWRSAELKAGGAGAAAAMTPGSKASVMSDMDVESHAGLSKASGLSMMSVMTDLGSQFSLLDFEMDKSTGMGLMSSTAVGQALTGAGFAATSSSALPPSQEEMEASQFVASVGAGLSGSPRGGGGGNSSQIKEEEENYDDVS